MFDLLNCLIFFSAVMFGAQSIELGINSIVVAGGMESMSNAPKYIAEARLDCKAFSFLFILIVAMRVHMLTTFVLFEMNEIFKGVLFCMSSFILLTERDHD